MNNIIANCLIFQLFPGQFFSNIIRISIIKSVFIQPFSNGI